MICDVYVVFFIYLNYILQKVCDLTQASKHRKSHIAQEWAETIGGRIIINYKLFWLYVRTFTLFLIDIHFVS